MAIHTIAREAENMAVNCHKLASLYGVSKRGPKNDLKEQMKKRLKLVDPREPEKPKPAYNYFIKENYPVIRKKSPDNSNRENMKELAALWRETRVEDKKVIHCLKKKILLVTKHFYCFMIIYNYNYHYGHNSIMKTWQILTRNDMVLNTENM